MIATGAAKIASHRRRLRDPTRWCCSRLRSGIKHHRLLLGIGLVLRDGDSGEAEKGLPRRGVGTHRVDIAPGGGGGDLIYLLGRIFEESLRPRPGSPGWIAAFSVRHGCSSRVAVR